MSTLAIVIFLALFALALGSLFLSGWRHRHDPPPPGIKPLTDADDQRWN